MSKTNSMKLDIYVNYPGHCKEAFQFYEQHLGGKITMMLTHHQQPNAANVSADWKNAILHARIEIGDTVLMGADIPNAEPMRSAYLTLRLETAKEAERIFALLSEGGEIFMKME
jgi:PhnB protein